MDNMEEIEIVGTIFGKQYGLRAEITEERTAEEVINHLTLAIRNTLVLRSKYPKSRYPNMTEEDLEEKMRTGDR